MSAPAPLPVVALVGRPNVGKSTLFNRILGQKQAVVHPTPGVTRDRNYGQAEHKLHSFFLVDTGGFEPETHDRMLIQMREQTLLAVEEADAIVFLADVLEPDNPTDDEIIQILRRSGKPIFLTVNKCDSRRREDEANFFARFGFDRIYPVSALHGTGILDLLDDLIEALPDSSRFGTGAPEATRIAIVGRQNAGKSTLLNRLLGEERVISNPIPGTTRDAIDTYIERDGKMYCLIDTAGIRRRGRIERGIEHLSVVSAVMAIQRCDVVILVVDAQRGIHQQDTHIGGAIMENWRPCIIALNKWDALEKDNATYGGFIKKTQEEFNFLPHAKIEAVSALSGQRCHKLWALIDSCADQAKRQVPTADLNRVVQAAVQRVTPPARGGRNLKIKYATQVASNPPTFVLFVNDPRLIHFSYKRYLLNRLRVAFGFEGTPIRIIFRRKSPPEGWEEYVRIREGLRQQKDARSRATPKPMPKWRGEEELRDATQRNGKPAPDEDMETVWIGAPKKRSPDDTKGDWRQEEQALNLEIDGDEAIDEEDLENDSEFVGDEEEWEGLEGLDNEMEGGNLNERRIEKFIEEGFDEDDDSPGARDRASAEASRESGAEGVSGNWNEAAAPSRQGSPKARPAREKRPAGARGGSGASAKSKGAGKPATAGSRARNARAGGGGKASAKGPVSKGKLAGDKPARGKRKPAKAKPPRKAGGLKSPQDPRKRSK